MIQLSILIPTLVSRRAVREPLIDSLLLQVMPIDRSNKDGIDILTGGKVQLLIYEDNKEISTGAKRQKLLEAAEGEYIVYLDCDDMVPPYYVSEFLRALRTKPDCVGIEGKMTTDGSNEIKWFLSKDNPNATVERNGKIAFLRTTNHITAVKRVLALKAGFPDKSNAEDSEYAARLHPYLKTEVKIVDKEMYHYRYLTTNKEYV